MTRVVPHERADGVCDARRVTLVGKGSLPERSYSGGRVYGLTVDVAGTPYYRELSSKGD